MTVDGEVSPNVEYTTRQRFRQKRRQCRIECRQILFAALLVGSGLVAVTGHLSTVFGEHRTRRQAEASGVRSTGTPEETIVWKDKGIW